MRMREHFNVWTAVIAYQPFIRITCSLNFMAHNLI